MHTFQQGARAYQAFARESREALTEHFDRHDKLPEVVFIDGPPPEGDPRAVFLTIRHAVCNLEFYNPEIHFNEVTGKIQVRGGTPLVSLRGRPFPVLVQGPGALRIYICGNRR